MDVIIRDTGGITGIGIISMYLAMVAIIRHIISIMPADGTKADTIITTPTMVDAVAIAAAVMTVAVVAATAAIVAAVMIAAADAAVAVNAATAAAMTVAVVAAVAAENAAAAVVVAIVAAGISSRFCIVIHRAGIYSRPFSKPVFCSVRHLQERCNLTGKYNDLL